MPQYKYLKTVRDDLDPAEVMKVKTHLWDRDRRVEYFDGRRWKRADSIPHAREIANRLGFVGISVEPV